MRGLLVRFLVSAAALGLTAWIVPGIHRGTVPDLLIAAVILGVLNAIVRPILLLLTLPINLLTLGLFTFVINAAMLKATDALVPSFRIDRFRDALLGAIVMAIISIVLNWVVKDARERD